MTSTLPFVYDEVLAYLAQIRLHLDAIEASLKRLPEVNDDRPTKPE